MKKIQTIFIALSCLSLTAQSLPLKLKAATENLLNTKAATSAQLSFYVCDTQGNFVYEYNGDRGLTTASTQKIFTAAAALETLGEDYRFKTKLGYTGTISDGTLKGNLILSSTGDPTLGSWRYDGYKPEDFQQKVLNALQDKGLQRIEGDIVIDDDYFDFQTIPGGYPWDDLGNYYGTGVWSVNWRENQFDMYVKGKSIEGFNIDMNQVKWVNDVSTGGDSDQSLIFTAPHSDVAFINGTLPANKKMTVSGSIPNPPYQLGVEIQSWLAKKNIAFNGQILTNSGLRIDGKPSIKFDNNKVLMVHQSPTLDKIVYWFLKKSVNLYGETLLKTMAKEKRNKGTYKEGVDFLKDFWQNKGINRYMINFADGSGLSPQNYVSARAEAQALLWAKKQPWYDSYYKGFPVQKNKMKMKSGTIRNTKSFAGYHNGYVFSIIINNYQGYDVSQALYNVLKHLN